MALNHGTNIYFNNFRASGEQRLLEDLIIESIKIYGQDMYYIPRELVSMDNLFTEDDQSRFSRAYPIEMYIKNVDGFEGDGVFLSKFGLEIRDQVTFTVAKRIFELEVTADYEPENVPKEGALIYFPLNQKLFQIKFVNYKPFFYQLGALQTYDLTCELFEYSGERFDTGLSFIDRIQEDFSIVIEDHAILDSSGNMILDENMNPILNQTYNLTTIDAGSDNNQIEIESGLGTETDQPNTTSNNSVIDWTYFDPFSENKY